MQRALKDDYYPIILGGDNCQTLGSAQAHKTVAPGTKTLWVDSMIDINQDETSSPEFSALEVQTGIQFKKQSQHSELQGVLKELKCMDISKDIAFIGACTEQKKIDAINFVLGHGGMVFGNTICQPDLVEQLHAAVRWQLAQRSQADSSAHRDFWISCNMNALDSLEFKSKTRSVNNLQENDGVTLAFMAEFMKHFAPQSIGMDLSDVNFQVAAGRSTRHADEQTFRELFELIIDSINKEPALPYDFHDSSFLPQHHLPK